MYKKILLPILTIIFIACNNSTDKSGASSDSTDKKMSSDTMSNMATIHGSRCARRSRGSESLFQKPKKWSRR